MFTWSEERTPNNESYYNHVKANIPFLGNIFIEWKGWKEYDTYSCYIYLGGDTLIEVEEYSLDDAKRKVEEQYKDLVLRAYKIVSN